MGRFTRRRGGDREWVQRLPEPFTMRDVLDEVHQDEMAPALTWLYDAIERGRVLPHQTALEMRYTFSGPRRHDDGRLAEVIQLPRRNAV